MSISHLALDLVLICIARLGLLLTLHVIINVGLVISIVVARSRQRLLLRQHFVRQLKSCLTSGQWTLLGSFRAAYFHLTLFLQTFDLVGHLRDQALCATRRLLLLLILLITV